MLLGFRVANYASVRDEAELSMTTGTGQSPGARTTAHYGTGALLVAALYGLTASGKSSILGALGFMRDAVVGSHLEWVPGAPVPRRPFSLTPHGRQLPTTLAVTFTCDSERYEYGFSVDDHQVTSEWLNALPGRTARVLFERSRENGIRFGPSLGGPCREIARVTRPDSLFLSAAAAGNHQQLTGICHWFRHGILPFQAGTSLRDSLTVREWEGPDGPVLRQLLRSADLGATDIEIRNPEPAAPAAGRTGPRPDGSPAQVSLVYEGPSGPVRLPAEDASGGTHAWVTLIGPLLSALRQGGLLLADGLDEHLHPLLAAQLVAAFQDTGANPSGAQLLFSTSKAFLFSQASPSPLHSDQVWVTEKGSDGATVLTPLRRYLARASAAGSEERHFGGRYATAQFLDGMEPG